MQDSVRTQVRQLLARIERELDPSAQPSRETGPVPVTDTLRGAFAELTSVLDLGPEPETRACPICGATGMRTATVCSNCWTKLTPPAAAHGPNGSPA